MKSIAELRSQPKGREERAISVCLAPQLVAEMQGLSERLAILQPDNTTGESTAPPSRLADPRQGEIREIHARMAEVLEEMAEDEGELRLRANKTDGEWRMWCNAHPVRAEGEPGYDRDLRVASGYCNADDLIDDLSAYVHQWNGEHLSAEDWAEVIEPRMPSADKSTAATEVVSMYEARRDFRRWRSNLSASLSESSDSSSPEPSASATSVSTVGKRAPSRSASTGKATGSP